MEVESISVLWEVLMRRVTFVVILGLVILLLFGCGERQASITGVVDDSESGNPLRNVIVTLGEHTAKTGADGHYQLDKVPPGSYTLTARMEGYNPYQRQLDVGGGQEVVLDINLSPLEEPSPLPVAEIEQAPHRMIERVSSAISPREGGSIAITEAESIYSNGFTLSIPPGALEEETVITVGDVTDDFPPIPEGLRPVGLPISLEPDGLSFQEPVTIKIPYSDEMLAWAGITSPEELLLKTYDLSAGKWADVPIAHVDTENRLVVARIDHFSLFSLFSWWNRKETENPATDEQIATYINESWGIVTSTGDLLEKLEYPNPTTAIPFRQEIGGILAVMAMAEQIQNEEYRKAAITGGEWLAWQALKLAGYGWLRPFALLVEVTYKGGVWFVKEVDEGAFNAQICAYLYYRREGYSVEDIKDLFVTDDGWVLTAMGTGCPPGYPRLTGRFKPEDVFRIGRAVWNATQSERYKERDTEEIRNAFIDAIRPAEPNQPPQVRITAPSEKAVFTAGEVVNLEGTAVDPEDGPLTGSSLTWRIETDGSSTFLGAGEALSLSEPSVGTHRIFLTAKDSQEQTAEDSVEITVQVTVNLPPQVTINTPSDGSVFLEGDPILFAGSAIDPEDGSLADRSLVWVSGIDGILGPGHTVTRDDLSPGTHAITLSATDSHSVFSTKTVTITIKPSTPNAEEALGGLHNQGFVVDIVGVERDEDRTTIRFSVFKELEHTAAPIDIPFTAEDNHGNQYSGTLYIDFDGAPYVLNSLPKGFMYVEEATVRIPNAAPLERLFLGETELPLRTDVNIQSYLLRSFPGMEVSLEESIQVGEWLTFKVEKMTQPWYLPFTVDNAEYNRLSAGVELGIQHRDGTVTWHQGCEESVPGVSSMKLGHAVPISIEHGPPRPTALFLGFKDITNRVPTIRIMPEPLAAFLPYDVPDKLWKEWAEDRFKMGFPVSEYMEIPTGVPGSRATGIVQGFEKGHFYYLTEGPNKGLVSRTTGELDEYYWNLAGGVGGQLGFPITEGIQKVELEFCGDIDYRHRLSDGTYGCSRYISAVDRYGRVKCGGGYKRHAAVQNFEGGYIGRRNSRWETVLFVDNEISGEKGFNIGANPLSGPWSVSGVVRLKRVSVQHDFLIRVEFSVEFSDIDVENYGSHIWTYYYRILDSNGIEYLPVQHLATGICTKAIIKSQLATNVNYEGSLVFPYPLHSEGQLLFDAFFPWGSSTTQIPFAISGFSSRNSQ